MRRIPSWAGSGTIRTCRCPSSRTRGASRSRWWAARPGAAPTSTGRVSPSPCPSRSDMNFGLIVSKQHPPGVSMVDRFREHIEQVRAARDAGFDLIVMGQHFLSTPFQELQTLPALARLAAEAGTMRVGATVLLLPLLNPVEVAEQVATLDVITEGRFIFGAGLGYREEEEVTHRGRYFHLTRARMVAKPVQKPHPPVWFAANNDAAVERAARMADAWVINPHATLPVLQRQM